MIFCPSQANSQGFRSITQQVELTNDGLLHRRRHGGDLFKGFFRSPEPSTMSEHGSFFMGHVSKMKMRYTVRYTPFHGYSNPRSDGHSLGLQWPLFKLDHSITLSIYESIDLSIYISIYLSTYLIIYLIIYLI